MFDDIKAGDTVYIKTEVVMGWNQSYGSYYLPHKVTRVTPKQFEVNGNMYRKDNGNIVSSGSFIVCRKLGQEIERWNKSEIVTDQSKEYDLAKRRVSMWKVVNDRLNTGKRIPIDHPELLNIFIHLQSIKELLEKE